MFLFLFFFLTVLKYLKCIDCWLSFENKTIWVILQRLALIGNGTKFSSIFFHTTSWFWCRNLRFSSLSPVIVPICSHSTSMKPSWYRVTGDSGKTAALPCRNSLGGLQMTSLSFMVAWNENPFVISVNLATWRFDQRFEYDILFLVHFIVFSGYIQESWILFPRQILQLRAKVTQWILRAWSNFVPGLQCATNADLPPCSHWCGWYISVHITFHNQYALSDTLIFILLSLY